MSSYHTSFRYYDKFTENSDGKSDSLKDKNLIIVAFEPDSGFTDTFLSMDNISDDYYDGTKKINYGSKYNSCAEIKITLMKKDGTDITLSEFRNYAKWLTGARIDSWLDMYVDDTLTYSFLGKFINLEQYKYDARTIALRLTFASVSPWAFSAPQSFECEIGQALDVIVENDNNILIKNTQDSTDFWLDDSVLCASNKPEEPKGSFKIDENGVLYIDTSWHDDIDNLTDDLYSYVYLDIEYDNITSDQISIKVENDMFPDGEETKISGLKNSEIINLSSKQFIVSYTKNEDGTRTLNPNRIFGDKFNFIWPRLAPGNNYFTVSGSGRGMAKFTYRYPMKVGDCTIDVDIHGNGIYCG